MLRKVGESAEEFAARHIAAAKELGTIQDTRPITYRDLKIIGKQANLIPFHPNGMQSAFNDAVYERSSHDWRISPMGLRRQRRIILKPRQIGFSTNTLGLYALDGWNKGYTKTIILAHDQKSTIELFKKVQLMHDNLPDWAKEKIGEPAAASKYEYFWPKIQTSFLIGTAGSEEFGRGQTPNNVLLSEVPSWPEGAVESIFTGMLNGVPMDGNVVMEYTAKGIGNMGYKLWVDAIDGKSAYRPMFYAWKDFPEYQLFPKDWDDFLPKGFNPSDITEEEILLQDNYGLTYNQLAWRRFKMLELPDDALFAQEYPLTWQEAFVSSSQSFFAKNTLAVLRKRVKEMEKYRKHGPSLIPASFKNLKKCLETSLGDVRKEDVFFYVWREPEEREEYGIVCDIAEGLNGSGKHDFCSASVYNLRTYEQVAHLHGYWSPSLFGDICAELGLWYSFGYGCLLCPERNNHGYAFISHIENGTSYPLGLRGLYQHEDDKFGYPQNVKTRTYALECGKEMVEDGSILINSERTLLEMETFVKKENRKIEALQGCFDDCVMELCIFAAIMYEGHKPSGSPVVGGQSKMVAVSPGRNFAPPQVFSIPPRSGLSTSR